MILADVMRQVSDRVNTIAGLRCFPYPTDDAKPPYAVLAYPEEIAYDETYGRGADRITLPLAVAVGKVSMRTTVAKLGAYVDGAGAKSIKAVVESGTYTAFDTVRVAGAEFDVVELGGTPVMAALFTLEIFGRGSP